jgi:hypothetical protein
MKKKGHIADDIWFDKIESGIYLRTDRQATKWMADLILELKQISNRSRYRDKSFKVHRTVTGDECWVTDILEGDYHFEEGQYKKAQECYQRIINNHPQNQWGHLRMKRLQDVFTLKN